MNQFICFCICLALVLGCVSSLDTQNKGRASIPSEVHLYFLEDNYKTKISIPSQYLVSYQIPTDGLSGTPSFRAVSGSTANVTSTGLVKPRGTTWYWKGNMATTAYTPDADRVTVEYDEGVTTFRVTAQNFSQDIKVNVSDFSSEYADNKINEIVAEITSGGLTDLQKLQNITKWVGLNTDYCTNYQSAKSMVIFECGDCWASTNTIVAMCKKVGIDAWSRRGNQDALAGSGHRNAIAYIDGKYYIAEAGYDGKRPRGHNVYEEPYGFSVSGSTIYQYDGKDTKVTVPSTINGKNITGFGKKNVAVFVNDGLESLHFTESIKTVGRGALYGTLTLKTITVDQKNQYLEAVNNALYTKWRNTLIYVPSNTKSLTIDENCTEISYTAMRKCNLDKLVIPKKVRTLDFAILYEAKVGELTIEEGIETIGETAFQSLSTPKIVLPDSVTSMGAAPFYYTNTSEVVLSKNILDIPIGCFQSSQVRKVDIQGKIRTIGENAFYSCSKLTNLTIPATVREIGNNAFSKSLKDIYFMGTEKRWKKITINYTIANTTTIHFNNETVDDSLEEEEDGGFPVWAGVVCAVVGAGLIAGAVVLAVFLAKRTKTSDSTSSVELAPQKPSQKTSAAPPSSSKPQSQSQSHHAVPSRPAPTAPPPRAPPTPARKPPATPPRSGGPSYLAH